MQFIDDFNETHMLFSKPVHFIMFEDDKRTIIHEFDMKLPTFEIFYFNNLFRQFVSLIHAPISDLQEQFVFIQGFTSHYQLINGLVMLKNVEIQKYLTQIKQAFQLLGVNLQLGTDAHPGLILIDDVIINEELFTRIVRIILISLALKKQSDFVDDPQMRAYQEKIDRIKRKNKPIQNSEQGDFKDAFMILTYEFGYKPEEILHMTQYAINMILGYTSKSIRYKLSLIAAGNGNMKKVKFITEKGK